MRTFNAVFVILAFTGCSSYSATIVTQNDAGTAAGGSSAIGGGAASSGGASTPGGSQTGGGTQPADASTAGGAVASGGTSVTGVPSAGAPSTGGAIAGIGGAPPSSGGVSAGGVAPTAGGANVNAGGASATTGVGAALGGTSASTGGASACSKDADCVNPDPVNCSYTCVNPGSAGTCKASVLIGNTRCVTPDCADRAISGFWDASGKPYVAYGFTESDGSASIRMQALKPDGTTDGEAERYPLPKNLLEPTILSAEGRGEQVGFLWEGTYHLTDAADQDVIYFAPTDTHRTSGVSNELAASPAGLSVSAMWLRTTQTGAWLAAWAGTSGGPIANWNIASGSTISTWTNPAQSPVQYQLEGAVVRDTLMLTGASCASLTSTCKQKFVLQRYSTGGLMPIGPQITLSEHGQHSSSLVMNSVQGRMAVLWTEEESPGLILSALINEDGTLARPITSSQSGIQPKAIVESSGGGALLIGTVSIGNPPKYQLVAQRLDAQIGVNGTPVSLANSEQSDGDDFETHPSSDGTQVLITYRQVGARYRLLFTNFCP